VFLIYGLTILFFKDALNFNRMSNVFVYHGVMTKSAAVSSEIFLNVILTAALEIPATITTAICLNTIGQKTLLSGAMLLGGVGCCISGYVPEGKNVN